MQDAGRLAAEFEAIDKYWSPRVVAMANGQYVKIAKVMGDFVWHSHAEEDEFFLVYRGTFILRYRDGSRTILEPGDFHVVPRGVEHFPSAPEEAWIIFVEPAQTRHTGDAETERTRSIEEQTAHLRREPSAPEDEMSVGL
ncbi:cupin [Paramesorhizobium deserti]|uniref:Cupin n=1 Tax=Paramesorhizobium deserti TaxID=1494590 RepID=A0A135HUE9_9HYPH|nr:cupin [Paramesorhizobium deserti]